MDEKKIMKKDPEWISINLGVVICITCSGIHRQLGTHISKIRSTTLDSWDKELKKLVLALGNKLCNSFLEANLGDASKPDSASSRYLPFSSFSPFTTLFLLLPSLLSSFPPFLLPSFPSSLPSFPPSLQPIRIILFSPSF